MQKIMYYTCYSTRLRKFLDQNGCHWVDKGFHQESGHPYWLFQKDDKLNDLLNKYKLER